MDEVESVRDAAAKLNALFELGRENNKQLTDRAQAVLADAVELATKAIAG